MFVATSFISFAPLRPSDTSPQRVEELLLLLSKLSHLDATRGEWLKAEGELNLKFNQQCL